MDNKPTTPNNNDQPNAGTSPVMDVKAPTNLNDVSMSDEGPTASKTPEVVPAGGTPISPLATPPAEAPRANQPAAAQPALAKKSGKKVKILLILVIAIVLAAAAVYLYLNKDKTTTTTTTTPASVATEQPTSANQDLEGAVSAVDSTIQTSDSAGDTSSSDLTDSTLGL